MVKIFLGKLPTSTILVLCSVLLLWFSSNSYTATAQASVPSNTVRVVLLYDDSCLEDCQNFLSNNLLQLESEYGQQLEILLINVSLPNNKDIQTELLSLYNLPLETTVYPVLIIGQSTLVGLPQIQQLSQSLVTATLEEGGNQLPSPVTTWLLQQHEDLQTKVAEKESSLRTQQLFLIGLSVVLLLTLIGLGFLLNRVKLINYKLKGIQTNLHLVQQEHQRLINTLIGNVNNSPDYLGGLTIVKYEYEKTGSTPPKAAYLAQGLLKTLEYDFQLKPVAPYARKVPFDATRHRSYENHQDNDMVWVVETGWEQGGKLLKPALVQNEFEVL